MQKIRCFVWVSLFILGVTGYLFASQQVKEVIEKYLLEKTKLTGTLDIYDEKINGVRNLRIIKVYDDIKQEGNIYTACMDYRDINSGDIVDVDIEVAENNNTFKVKSLKIHQIKELKEESAPEMAAKVFSDANIQDFIKNYYEQQAKFTGFLSLYDEENSQLRNLELIEIFAENRKFGILNILKVDFKDKQTQETVSVDITVEQKNNALSVQKMKIKDIKSPQK